jgi:hypothetical protein
MSSELGPREPDHGSLIPLEPLLAGFVPAAPRIDRDRLMFLAGRASMLSPGVHDGQRRVNTVSNRAGAWLWPAATATLAATSLALLVLLLARPSVAPQIVDRRSTPIQPAAAPVAAAAVPADRPGISSTMTNTAIHAAIFERPAVATGSYLHSRDVALRLGIDALGSGFAAGGGEADSPLSYRELLEVLSASTADRPSDKSQPGVQM